MLSPETIATFTIASVLLCLAPGPDNIFVLMQSAVHGRKAGLLVTIGLCTGLVGHTLAVALGVAAVFQTSEVAFTILKLLGTAYLLYLAWKAFTASSQKLDKPVQLKPGELYRRGVIMNITNPKVSLFFLAFLPQFVSDEAGPVTIQIILLGLVFILCTAVVFGSVALLAGMLGEWLGRSPKAQFIMNKIAGVVFVALAIRIAMAVR
ncbi:MAG: LysE family translocator [Puniceicoccaceae bacterium]